MQLDNYGPMKRDRTILVFVRVAESQVFRTPACPWLPKGDATHTLETFQCLAQDDLLDSDLQINEFQRKILSDPDLAKVATSKQAWNARLISPSEKLPTIQHLYVESINMNRKTLLEHGLHCPVLNAAEPRFVSPWEVARGMMHPQSTALPCEARTAWKLLGNSVSPLQCAVGLCAVELALGKLTRVEADATVLSFPQDGIRINGVTPCTVHGWTTFLLPLEGSISPNPGSPDSDVKSDDSARACGIISGYSDFRTEEEEDECAMTQTRLKIPCVSAYVSLRNQRLPLRKFPLKSGWSTLRFLKGFRGCTHVNIRYIRKELVYLAAPMCPSPPAGCSHARPCQAPSGWTFNPQ